MNTTHSHLVLGLPIYHEGLASAKGSYCGYYNVGEGLLKLKLRSNDVRTVTVQFKLPLYYALLKTERLKSRVLERALSLFVTEYFFGQAAFKVYCKGNCSWRDRCKVCGSHKTLSNGILPPRNVLQGIALTE